MTSDGLLPFFEKPQGPARQVFACNEAAAFDGSEAAEIARQRLPEGRGALGAQRPARVKPPYLPSRLGHPLPRRAKVGEQSYMGGVVLRVPFLSPFALRFFSIPIRADLRRRSESAFNCVEAI
jgi:hypothetical protein